MKIGFGLIFALLLASCTAQKGVSALKELDTVSTGKNNKVVEQYVEVNGIRLHYLQKGQGPVIVMLHGFPEHSGLWQKHILNLSSEFNVIAPDMRGYNLSDQPASIDAYKIETLMQDITELSKKMSSEKVCLVGHDWGGLLSWYVAGHHPEVFKKVVILNAGHPTIYRKLYETDPDQKSKASYITTFMTPGSEAALAQNNFQALQGAVFAASTHAFTDAEKEDLIAAWGRGLVGGLNYYRSYMPRAVELNAKLPKISIPTLVLWGEKDQALILKNLDGLHEYVNELTVKTYPDATHWITYEKPDEISDQIREFCRD